ncbi:PEGA domain-containing protein [uncultured Methanospirillum sp.]|uniref:PEGA domain-containing protein n=1 Tax=uncultured Methanospirillum sp. TaxID=262503 RepID=UPI0029C8DA02|nr:PEGA domain-containing protein [uncultured Methanospirillum sp.]
MSRYLFTAILFTLYMCAGCICFAETNGNMNVFPTEENTFNPGDEPPYTQVPTDQPTLEPTITVEPINIGGDNGFLSVDSDPQGANVYLDDSNQGVTPALIRLYSTGTPSHNLRVSKNGYQDWTDLISENPKSGETIYRTVNLVKIQPTITVEPTSIGGDSGFFKIDSIPSGADAYVDTDYYGGTPLLVKIPTTATPSHDIRVTMNGYRDYTEHISTNPGKEQIYPILATLVPLTQYGGIYVSSDPAGALATLDGGTQYLTPCTFNQVISGMHTVTVSKEGYYQYTTQVQVNFNAQPRVFAPLTKYQKTGTLFVDSVPQGADIKVDNMWQGQTPQQVGNLESGYHTVKLQLSGYQTISQQALITAGQQTSIRQSLVKTPPEISTGSVAISSTPPGASVSLNTDYQGVTPVSGSLDLTDITPGVYTITLTAPQRETYSSTITVIAGQVTPVQVELKSPKVPSSQNGTLSVSSSPAGAQVLLDNLYIGITPLTLSSVKPAQYELILKMEQYQNNVNQVRIEGGMSTTVSVNMTPIQKPTTTPVPTQSPFPAVLVPISMGTGALLFRRLQQL